MSCNSFDTKRSQKCRHAHAEFQFGVEQEPGCKAPFFQRGEGGPQPQKSPPKKNLFLSCFLVLQKGLNGASPQHIFGSPGPEERHFICIFTKRYSVRKRRKPALLHCFGALREQPGTQIKRTKSSILPACSLVLASWVKG